MLSFSFYKAKDKWLTCNKIISLYIVNNLYCSLFIMEIKTLDEAKSIRSKKQDLESKIAEIAKTDPDRAKKLHIALQVASVKADRIIGDGMGGDKEMIPLAPREEPMAAPVVAKPYIAAVRKKIQPNKNTAPALVSDDKDTILEVKKVEPIVEIKAIDISKDASPTKKLEQFWWPDSIFAKMASERAILDYWKTTTMDPSDRALADKRFKEWQAQLRSQEDVKNKNKILKSIADLENEKKQKFAVGSQRPAQIENELRKLRWQLR